MESGNVTTPFGRRLMTFGMLASQAAARRIEPGQSIDKWKLYRALCEAKPLLGITDRALAILNALLSFYPKGELSEDNGLVVFPSNAQLSLRAHGMAEQTIRRHLASLVEAGLLIRKDSPNGKRYARKEQGGDIREAFGFSLAPLLARADEIERLAAEVAAERLYLQRLRERLTLCRRDVAKLIEMALEEGVAGDWGRIHLHFRDIVERLPRSPSAAQIAAGLDELELLRDEITNQLELHEETRNQSGNAPHYERHIQNSNPHSITEFEPSFETKQGATADDRSAGRAEPAARMQKVEETNGQVRDARSASVGSGGLKSFPLGLVLQACPEIAAYGPQGSVGSWRDLMAAAVVVRSMLGVSPSAYEQACEIMGPENAATVIACVLERSGHINSAGGYLRDLTRRAERGEFAIGPMLMALARTNLPIRGKTG
ncbi:plasmid replication protein RepC [Rhizobium binae]|uniref:Replication initiation protein RepC n=1 Tax=Rhizobium binae TaxID=1138190 RepID=A0ABV2MI83_9HYPH|nr:plasmid replication protein RepC [Rhizobium binae]NKL48608.1 replication initiation protein RepC [Rhizobium leguminosarum bv. viciae]MBX4925333.1 replication initiation protein RepC [Rhizobium binae]MBX4936288.1 replication initiation protein RepC [Rhizobium binae]MBX4942605.1 replication initiation protein RepC [Rhizobium binae]MBX4950413.1 replication initiation protein RepC [Rhizobium binae]